MIDGKSLIKNLIEKGFGSFQRTPKTVIFWYDLTKGYDISVEYRSELDETYITGYVNGTCAYRRTGAFTEQEILSYIDECIILLKNIIVRKRITDIDKDFKK